jgi:hypothetical protein
MLTFIGLNSSRVRGSLAALVLIGLLVACGSTTASATSTATTTGGATVSVARLFTPAEVASAFAKSGVLVRHTLTIGHPHPTIGLTTIGNNFNFTVAAFIYKSSAEAQWSVLHGLRPQLREEGAVYELTRNLLVVAYPRPGHRLKNMPARVREVLVRLKTS